MKVIKHQAADSTLHDSAKAAFEHDALRTIDVEVSAMAVDGGHDSDTCASIATFIRDNAVALRALLNKALTRKRTYKAGE